MPIEISWQRTGATAGGRTVLTGNGPFRIGRSSGNDVALDHPQVSRFHAEVRLDGGRVTIIDQKSQNGTLIAGNRITSAQWREGDLPEEGLAVVHDGPGRIGRPDQRHGAVSRRVGFHPTFRTTVG